MRSSVLRAAGRRGGDDHVLVGDVSVAPRLRHGVALGTTRFHLIFRSGDDPDLDRGRKCGRRGDMGRHCGWGPKRHHADGAAGPRLGRIVTPDAPGRETQMVAESGVLVTIALAAGKGSRRASLPGGWWVLLDLDTH